MPLFMAKHSMKTKYISKQQTNYTEEDKIINKPLSCMELNCNEYHTDKDGTIDQSQILAYNIEDNQKMKSKDSYQN